MITLANGTRINVGPSWVHTILPGGAEVHAHPSAESREMAIRLGYGEDVAALTREHDVLHSSLCDLLGLPYSLSLAQAAGLTVSPRLALLEERAVLAVQEFKARWDRRA